jgi:methionyl-tRNA formyltransferase
VRVVFMGTPAFAVPSLSALLGRHDVAVVYTRPDRPTGRGRRPANPPVKEVALEAGVPVEQPATLREPGAADRLAGYRPDVVVVAAYGAILPPEFLAVPRLGCVNVHASLLPRWRGAAPVQRAILAGDDTSGVSIMRMEEGLDTGPWAIQMATAVDDHSAAALTGELAVLGADALMLALDALEEGTLVWTPQDESRATYASKVTSADVALSPGLCVQDALRRVRASGPSAPCRVQVGGRVLVVTAAEEASDALAQGTASSERDLVLGFADGAIRLLEVVPEGRPKMQGAAFARGARLGDCTWSAL